VLLERGLDLLERDESGRLLLLLGEIVALSDANRCLWAMLALIERASQPLLRAPPAHVESLRLLAAGGLDLLEREPEEPVLLWRVGRLLDILGASTGAEALLGAARGLDPELLAELEEADAGAVGVRSVAGVVAADEELSRRALDLAKCVGREAKELRLSLCMIVRDEEEMLERCLISVADAVDQIVVVDTGSVDRSVEIARSFGAEVIDFGWTGSFAEARNVSLDAAECEWILFLDADEVLVGGSRERLRELTRRRWCEGFDFTVLNHTGDIEDGTSVSHTALRMFRNRPHHRFEGRLHEQIAERLPAFLPGRVRRSGLGIEHFGYLRAVRSERAKSERNIALLRLQQAEGPPSAFLHFNLGSEHAAAGDHEAAVLELERAWSLLSDPRGEEFAPALIRRLIGALRAGSRHEEAISLARGGLELFPDFTDLVFEQALAHAALGETELAAELFERCLTMGDAPSRYPSDAGCGSHLALVQLAETRRAGGEPVCALALLERCLSEHPSYLGAIVPYVGVRLADGGDGESLVEALDELLGGLNSQAHLVLGQALRDCGRPIAAQRQLELVLEQMPDSDLARVALAEVLIAQRRNGEAVAALEGVSPAGAHRLSAARTKLFALLAGGAEDQAAAGLALTRAQADGMSAPELDLFEAWRALISSGSTDLEPGLASIPRLLAMLETLLLAQDFEGFERLLGLLARSSLPERERRELLAELYLRCGFHSSAAEEWMAVAGTAPDARAMLGLARVAMVRAMPQEAEQFAAAALELGGGEPAAALLSRLQPMST
jgi:tetratricopeptide (TPR) repeat protein